MSEQPTTPAPIPVGAFDGPCNRSACRAPHAKWWNIGSERYYCGHCAKLINETNMTQLILCFLHDTDIRLDPTASFYNEPPGATP